MEFDETLQRIHDLPLSVAIREGSSLFPWIEAVHVLAIVTVVGSISIIDLRLIGVPAHRKSFRRLTLDLLPFTWVAFALALMSGSLMFISNAILYAHNGSFQTKMVLLVLAGLNMAFFHLVTARSVHLWDEMLKAPLLARLAGFLSLALWVSVVFYGRWVGFTLSPF